MNNSNFAYKDENLFFFFFPSAHRINIRMEAMNTLQGQNTHIIYKKKWALLKKDEKINDIIQKDKHVILISKNNIDFFMPLTTSKAKTN